MRIARGLTTLLAIAVVTPNALAQAATHPIAVTIPSYVGIRLVGATGGPERRVVFDYGADTARYLAATESNDLLAPTEVDRFDDVEVNIVGWGTWVLYVEATPFTYTGPGHGVGLELGDVRVVRGSASGLVQEAITEWWFLGAFAASWPLDTSPRAIAYSVRGTGGWRSLGFNGRDYSVAVDGDEEAGTYATTVTYFLTFP